MNLVDILVWTITFCIFSLGLIMLFFPASIVKIEDKLNSTWGNTEVLSLRLGSKAEKHTENILNRPVLEKSIVWDAWSKTNPRLTGIVLCLSALVLIGFHV